MLPGHAHTHAHPHCAGMLWKSCPMKKTFTSSSHLCNSESITVAVERLRDQILSSLTPEAEGSSGWEQQPGQEGTGTGSG